jgi:hypothetical protein
VAQPKTAAQKRKLAKLLADEGPVTPALEQAGWSHKSSLKGWAKLPSDVLKSLPKKAQRLIALGKMDKKDLEHMAVGRLAKNVPDGKDGGAQSAKILGSHREINAWTADQQLGLVILQTPLKFTYPEYVKKCLRPKSRENASHEKLLTFVLHWSHFLAWYSGLPSYFVLRSGLGICCLRLL